MENQTEEQKNQFQFERYEWKDQTRGQTMMEYIVLVALLAVASIPIAKVLGDVFRDRVLRSADEIAGGENYQSEGDKMVQEGRDKVKRSMKDF